ALPSFRRVPGSTCLRLEGLSPAGVAQLIASVSSVSPATGAATAMHEMTSGNPLFITQLVADVVESGRLALLRRAPEDVAAALEEHGALEGVRQVILARVRRLPAAARRLLSVAAVFSRAFLFGVAAAAADLDEPAALAAVESALEARLICPGGDEETYVF